MPEYMTNLSFKTPESDPHISVTWKQHMNDLGNDSTYTIKLQKGLRNKLNQTSKMQEKSLKEN